MKILYVITKSEIGGAQTQVSQLAKNLSRDNEVAIMSSPRGWLEEFCLKENIKFYPNKYFKNSFNPINAFKALFFVRKIVKKMKPDIVHCHSGGGGFFGRLGSVGLPVKKIFTVHGWSFRPGTPFVQKIISWKIEFFMKFFTDMVICVSEYDLKLGLKCGVISKEKSCVVYNGVETPKSLIIQKDESKFNIIFAGRFAEPKRQDLLIKAVADLREDLKEKVFIKLVGSGPKKDYLQNLSDSLSVKNIDFYSVDTNKMNEEYQKSDLLVLLSNYEALPMVIIEAMANSLPVIATNVGGIPEEANDTFGLLVKNEVSDIKEAIEKLITSDMQGIKTAAFNTYKEKFTLDRFIKDIEKIYSNLTI